MIKRISAEKMDRLIAWLSAIGLVVLIGTDAVEKIATAIR